MLSKFIFAIGILTLIPLMIWADEQPQHLYKVTTIENWKTSQGQTRLTLSENDRDFIHFATDEQLERILQKYWADVPVFMVLKIETSKLPGELIFESNPGGTTKYYHLYDGYIPLKAIVEANERHHP